MDIVPLKFQVGGKRRPMRVVKSDGGVIVFPGEKESRHALEVLEWLSSYRASEAISERRAGYDLDEWRFYNHQVQPKRGSWIRSDPAREKLFKGTDIPLPYTRRAFDIPDWLADRLRAIASHPSDRIVHLLSRRCSDNALRAAGGEDLGLFLEDGSRNEALNRLYGELWEPLAARAALDRVEYDYTPLMDDLYRAVEARIDRGYKEDELTEMVGNIDLRRTKDFLCGRTDDAQFVFDGLKAFKARRIRRELYLVTPGISEPSAIMTMLSARRINFEALSTLVRAQVLGEESLGLIFSWCDSMSMTGKPPARFHVLSNALSDVGATGGIEWFKRVKIWLESPAFGSRAVNIAALMPWPNDSCLGDEEKRLYDEMKPMIKKMWPARYNAQDKDSIIDKMFGDDLAEQLILYKVQIEALKRLRSAQAKSLGARQLAKLAACDGATAETRQILFGLVGRLRQSQP